MVAEHITNLASSKHSGKRSRTQMLVVHSAETPLANGYAASVTLNWLNRADVEASINAFFGPDTTVRSVHTDYAAWHATWANALSVGYEFTGYAALNRAQWLTTAGQNMLDRAGREMAADAKIYGIPLRWLTTSEVNAIANGNTTIKGLSTHRQIDPVNRTDPGDGFPYDVLLDNIKRYSGISVASPVKPTPIPTPAPKPAPVPANTFVATVDPGDSLTSIAAQFGTTVAAILAVNKLANKNVIHAGQKLNIPVTNKPAVPKPAPAPALVNRIVTFDRAYLLTRPTTAAPTFASYPKGTPLAIKGYVGGQDPYGTGDTAWYVTGSGHYVWANAAENNVSGLKFLGNL